MMKWYIKVLRHYADFSGRARRTEFWMFVLFNVIFIFAWTFLLSLVFVFTKKVNQIDLNGAVITAYTSYSIALMLPGMAVTVRRLHDTGKSGWMLLVGLIPLIGGIWLLVLMLQEGQQGSNQYGTDPKTSQETFTEPAKLKSVGIALIVASAFAILIFTLNMIMMQKFHESSMLTEVRYLFQQTLFFAVYVLLLAAGMLLLNEKQIHKIRGEGKSAVVLLLTSFSISFLLSIFFFTGNLQAISQIGWLPVIGTLIDGVVSLTIALFAASLLFASQNKNVIRIMALFTIIISSVLILWFTYSRMGANINVSIYERIGWNWVVDMISAYHILLPVAFIVLAGTFLWKGQQPDVNAHTPPPTREKLPEPNVSATPPLLQANKPNLRSFGKEVKGLYTYEYFKANSAEEAKLFLSFCEVTKPNYYIQVETPEGVWGMDKEGLYLVELLPFQKNLALAQCEGNYTSFPYANILMAAHGAVDNFVCDIVCGSCGHQWKDALRVKRKTIVKCPSCKKYNSVDTSNINII